MQNYKLTISYDGTRYAGWQTQESRQRGKTTRRKIRTIQGEIESALGKIFQKNVCIEGSGRTDAGVHATAQTAHFKAEKSISPEKIRGGLNGLLPQDIVVTDVKKVPRNFHARFDVKSKTYDYLIYQAGHKTPFFPSFAWFVRQPLNVRWMRQEAKTLLGRHDFKSFQAADRCERSAVTNLKRLEIKKQRCSTALPFLKNVDILTLEIEATGFSRGMVRNIVGTLVDIGRGKISRGVLKTILLSKDRKNAGVCAPAAGLYLTDVKYDEI